MGYLRFSGALSGIVSGNAVTMRGEPIENVIESLFCKEVFIACIIYSSYVIPTNTHFRGLMPLFEKILVPLDGSENSMQALENAVQIAKKFNGKIILIHVYSISACRHAHLYFDKCVQALRKAGTDILVDGEKKVKAEGVQVQTLLRAGHTVEEILKAARGGKFSLIVMGARGISKIKEILMGSISDGVTRHAPCPVFVVK